LEKSFLALIQGNFGLCKDEDSISYKSLIGSTISIRSQKNASCSNKIYSPSVLSHDTKTSKESEKSDSHYFCSQNLNHACLSKPDFEAYETILRRILMKVIITLVMNFNRNQTILLLS
jgi:hypothetical protein